MHRKALKEFLGNGPIGPIGPKRGNWRSRDTRATRSDWCSRDTGTTRSPRDSGYTRASRASRRARSSGSGRSRRSSRSSRSNTGPAGPVGAGISDFLSVFQAADPGTGTDTVPGNSPITLTGVLANVGGAFTFVPPSSTITINETGSYLISFSIHNQGDADFNLTVNGTPITPVPFTGNGGGPVSAEVIVTVTTVPTTIQLVNANATPAQLHNNLNTTVTILKLTP